ncbi:MAG: hypothetical protein RI931_192 [Actinomycetota bacterium]
MNRPRLHTLLGLALIFSLMGFAPAPSWAGCKNSGGGSSAFSYGSEVAGNAVTICGNTSVVVPARSSTTVKPVPKAVAKLPAKPVAKPAPKPLVKVAKPLTMADIRALIRISDVPSPKPIVVAKPKPKPVPMSVVLIKAPTKAVSVLSSTPASASAANGSANFSPDEASAAVSPSSDLMVGEMATFYSDPMVHYRLGAVLGYPAEVRFSPVQTTWQFGDGLSGSGAQTSHAFRPGNFDVRVTITYAVSYRLVGQLAWILDPGQIQMPAVVQVSVSDSSNWSPPEEELLPASKVPYLVSANCLANSSSVGCL